MSHIHIISCWNS